MTALLPAALLVAVTLGMLGHMVGIIPIPVGRERGKVKWLTWCATGAHYHVCYWHSASDGYTDTAGLQSIHPDDISGGESE
jgi:hypothetical protein